MNKLSVKQNGFRDCASACLLSIIRHYGGNISKEEISYTIKTDKHGTNAYNLIEGAKTLGFDGYGLKKTYEELLEYGNLPVIAHTNVKNMYHYIVIYENGYRFPSSGNYKSLMERHSDNHAYNSYKMYDYWVGWRPWNIDQSITLEGIN